jgi:hypothetical protein
MALGIFHDVDGDPSKFRGRISPEVLPSYTLSAIVLSDGGNMEIGIQEMRELMLGKISGGFELLSEKVKEKAGIKALKETAGLMPL